VGDVFNETDYPSVYLTSAYQPFLMPIITFKLHGRTWRMLIDTGSMTTLWPKEILLPNEKLLDGELEIRGISGNSIKPMGSILKKVDLVCYQTGRSYPTEIRGLVFKDLSAIKGADGILGMDFLYQNNLQLDLPNHRIHNQHFECHLEEMRIPPHLMGNINAFVSQANESPQKTKTLLNGEIDVQIVNDTAIRGWSEQMVDIVLPEGARNRDLLIDEQWLQEGVLVFACLVKSADDGLIQVRVQNQNKQHIQKGESPYTNLDTWNVLQIEEFNEETPTEELYVVEKEDELIKHLNLPKEDLERLEFNNRMLQHQVNLKQAIDNVQRKKKIMALRRNLNRLKGQLKNIPSEHHEQSFHVIIDEVNEQLADIAKNLPSSSNQAEETIISSNEESQPKDPEALDERFEKCINEILLKADIKPASKRLLQ
jgi:hypothetical protein